MRKLGWGRLAALVLLGVLIVLRIFDPTVLQIARDQSFDLYQRLKPRTYVQQPVAILDVDEASLQRIGQWPWPRTKLAEMVEKLTAAGAVVAGFDMIFAEADRLSPDLIAEDNAKLPEEVREALRRLPSSDSVFAAAIARSRIVMGQTTARRSQDSDKLEASTIVDTPYAFLGPDPSRFLFKYPALLKNRAELEAAALGKGLFTVLPDADNVFRRVPLVFLIKDKFRLALTLEMLRVGVQGRAFGIKSDVEGIQGIKIGRVFVPTDKNGSVRPYLTPSLASRFVSAADLIEGKVPAGRLRGHLVLVGTSAAGLEDYRATPLAVTMAGVEIHAQVLENIMTKTLLTRPSDSLRNEILITLVVGLLAIIFVPMLSALWAAAGATLLIGAYIGYSWWSFSQDRLLVDPVFPPIAIALLFVLLATYNYIREERQRREIRGAFGQYVSPALVNELAEHPEGLKLGGETRELSILFSDVRGFTAISESYIDNPQGLTELMNQFLTALSKSILKHEGTIDKFMGDAVMAFWNAPTPHEQHARSSCLAAIEMLDAVHRLNEENAANHESNGGDQDGPLHKINIGIGINSGECVVGNMGSDDRFDYTCLGDAVNLASRLEGQSKPYGVAIVLGQATAHLVHEEFATIELDRIRVKGKQEPETIYGLYGDETVLADQAFIDLERLNADMLNSYRKQDWETASALVQLMREQSDEAGIELDNYLFIYDTRIAEFQHNPPGRNWDGVYTATSK